jgi:transcriptional regulator with GAF, ATPase, and Fis domain
MQTTLHDEFPVGPQTDALLAALRRRGVEIEVATADPSVPSLAFVDADDPPAAIEAVRNLCQGGARRALLLTDSRSPLGSQACWDLLRAGASDIFEWRDAELSAEEIAARLRRWHVVDELVRSPLVQNQLIGSSPAWLATLRQVVEIAQVTTASVLLLGASGTGKELIARLIHTLDARHDKRDLVVLDCTTVSPELAGSEFFGHERGAFTGANMARDGAFALAHQGTLFLDEIGELPLGLQAQLLRAVQERSFKRVGANHWSDVRFRLVCATHRDLAADVQQGRFRNDFFHRIATRIVRVPTLDERVSDIPLLAAHFLRQRNPAQPALPFHPAVAEFLQRRAYAGNVRELWHLVGRIADRHVGPGPVTPGDIPSDELAALGATDWQDRQFELAIERAVALGGELKEIGRAATNLAIRSALATEAGNVQRAARRLGVTDRALQLRRAQGDG